MQIGFIKGHDTFEELFLYYNRFNRAVGQMIDGCIRFEDQM